MICHLLLPQKSPTSSNFYTEYYLLEDDDFLISQKHKSPFIKQQC